MADLVLDPVRQAEQYLPATGEEPDPIAGQRVIPRYLIELTIGSTMQHPNKKSQPLRCGHQMNKHLD